METNVRIKIMREGVKLPEYATAGSAALDLRSAFDTPRVIAAHTRLLVPTGIAIALERSTVALVCARSGLSTKHGIALANGIGVIDSDYRGEIFVSLINNSDEDYSIEPDERIAQLMFVPVYAAAITVVDELDETERGEGGFGSTGVK